MLDKRTLHLGIDIGSTTIKMVVMDGSGEILFAEYRRHFSDMAKSFLTLMNEIYEKFPSASFTVALAGSGALGVAEVIGLQFVQEVVAASTAIKKYIPETQVAIELGGEDGKITFFDKKNIDQRMNETCAGGTGAFIDQMAVLLKTDAAGLNELAKGFTTLYPIAARCGVFAKTDIMPLLNEGADRSNIAASIFQAVVDQTIGGLACGRKIRGKVAFLGGPLSFLPQLRARFVDTLRLAESDVVFPANSLYFVALGAAILGKYSKAISAAELLEKVKASQGNFSCLKEKTLPPLFGSEKEYVDFKNKHNKAKASYAELAATEGEVFLGLDAGSTTTKAVLIDGGKNILKSWYMPNQGNPLNSAVQIVKDMYRVLPAKATLKGSAITGYGEGLIKAALGFDVGEVETIAHYKAAAHFAPDVSFILDIGGQDMKCIYIKKGVVDKIVLNEACSSGCGSFLSTFAESLGLDMQEFVDKALRAKAPVDLGSRCTVFMNSKIKQSQKEGAEVGDISAGLAYSVVKNALYKVIKIASPEALGKKIVVQGGTFYNDAVLKALEYTIGREVVRPDIAGVMGAYGAALIALERQEGARGTALLSKDKLDEFKVENRSVHCGKCSNNCLLTVSLFPNGKRFISGNRCERGAGLGAEKSSVFNMIHYKYDRLFNHYKADENAPKGKIGVPRVLNIYEDFPFWFVFLSKIGFEPVLSDASSREMFNKGLESITSQTLCFPAKVVHGHIVNLVQKGIKTIFYPCVPYEEKEFSDAHAQYNCPVVTSYPEVVRLNMDILREEKVRLIQPFLPIHNLKVLKKRLYEVFSSYGVGKRQIAAAVAAAAREEKDFRREIRELGAKVVGQIQAEGGKGIVLAGRPYHLDPFINHGIPDKIASEGLPVLTEDAVAHLGAKLPFPLRVVDQWVYHSRLYRAANFVAHDNHFELIQLNSFGCGIDAITTGQVEDILSAAGKITTVLKIDEGSNLGAVRIRIRSLIAAMKKEDAPVAIAVPEASRGFALKMRADYTILCPQMSPVHFRLIHSALAPLGYNLQVLPDFQKSMIEEGLRYVNNDACYPAIIVIGQLIAALKSGKYDVNRTALIISQTSGGCRATNYVSLLKMAVKQAGFPDVPIIALNMQNMKKCGLKVTPVAFMRLIMGFAYGDLLLRVSNACRPYEKKVGEVDALVEKWFGRIEAGFAKLSRSAYVRNVRAIVKEFDALDLRDIQKPKVGIVGEILVKFHPDANNHLVKMVEKEGGEAVVPDFMDFINYVLQNNVHNYLYLAGAFGKNFKSKMAIAFLERYFRNPMREALGKSKRFKTFERTVDLAKRVKKVVSVCNQMGEGWLLTAEMVELIEGGVPNIICVQPFACLPNHITGKGVIKELKRLYEDANIAAIDYDPGASEVNQINRIKLMMSSAG